MHSNFKDELRQAYDQDAKRRDDGESKRDQWKLDVRSRFVDLLKTENKQSVLELGAGSGYDSLYFQDNGFNVLAVDLSPQMVEMCQKRRLRASTFDLYNLRDLNEQFDAIYSLNVSLHIPRRDIDMVLSNIHSSLKDNGIFFYGVYGGMDEEKTVVNKNKIDLPRFFSFLSDETLLDIVKPKFEVIHFETIDIASKTPNFHFQSLLLKKK